MTPHPGSITCMTRMLGPSSTKHWTVYEKFFYRAAWSTRTLSMLVLVRPIAPLLGDTILLAIDSVSEFLQSVCVVRDLASLQNLSCRLHK